MKREWHDDNVLFKAKKTSKKLNSQFYQIYPRHGTELWKGIFPEFMLSNSIFYQKNITIMQQLSESKFSLYWWMIGWSRFRIIDEMNISAYQISIKSPYYIFQNRFYSAWLRNLFKKFPLFSIYYKSSFQSSTICDIIRISNRMCPNPIRNKHFE